MLLPLAHATGSVSFHLRQFANSAANKKGLADLWREKKNYDIMNQKDAKAQMTVWWALWVAFQTGIFILYHFLTSSAAQDQTQAIDSSVWSAGLAPLTISVIIRWFVLPRVQNAQTALLLFVIGIAMAEATCFLGIFIFTAHKQELFTW